MSALAHRDGVRKQGEMWPSEKGRLCTKVIFFRLVLPIFVLSMTRLMTYAYFVNVPPQCIIFECLS